MILLTLASLAIVLLAVSIYNKLKTDNISLINIILNKDNEHTHIREGFKEGNLSYLTPKYRVLKLISLSFSPGKWRNFYSILK